MDKFSKEKRSHIMSRIRGKDTKPEILLRKTLYSSGYRGYRVHRTLASAYISNHCCLALGKKSKSSEIL